MTVFTMYNENFGNAIGLFSDIIHYLKDIYDRKALFLNICEEIDFFKWTGISLLVKDVIEELINNIGDAITYSIGIRFLGLKFPEISENLSRELVLRIDELAEWEYDRVIALLMASQGLININRLDLSKEALEKAIDIIPKIPDRSDRSDALAKAIKLLAFHNEIDRAIKLLENIHYEPKKMEAIFYILDAIEPKQLDKKVLEKFESKLDSYDIPIYRAKLAERLAEFSPKSAYKICDGILKKINITTVGSLRDLTVVQWCIRAYLKGGEKQLGLAREYFLKIVPNLLRRLEERPFLELFINLLQSFIEKRYSLDIVDKLIEDVMEKAKTLGEPNSLFILNRIAVLMWKRGKLEASLEIFRNSFFEAKKMKPPMSAYSTIDIGVNLAKILNMLPETIPSQIIIQMAQAVSPSERPILEITISRENLNYIREISKGKALGLTIDNLISRERILNTFNIYKKTREIIFEFLKRGEPIVLHYILKFIHRIPIGESERSVYLRLLGKTVELFSAGKLDEVMQYVNLILDKLEKENFPTYVALIEFLSEYLIKVI